MRERLSVLVVSDIHYASDEEKVRTDFEARSVDNPAVRFLLRCYRRYVWLKDPFGHNDLLQRVLTPPSEPDLVVANGDYSCDSAFIGLADPPSRRSAELCLGGLRERYGKKFLATPGDHEFGKVSLAGGKGGLRYESWEVATNGVGLQPFWMHRVGKCVLLGVTSTLLAFPVYEGEALPSERSAWRERRAEHLRQIGQGFASLDGNDQVILFCHDPTALPFLLEVDAVRERLGQIQRTIIGHLHSNLVLFQSRILAGLPPIRRFGTAVKRMSLGLRQAKKWGVFKPLLCPSLAGIELLKRGGYYLVELDPQGREQPRFQLQVVKR